RLRGAHLAQTHWRLSARGANAYIRAFHRLHALTYRRLLLPTRRGRRIAWRHWADEHGDESDPPIAARDDRRLLHLLDAPSAVGPLGKSAPAEARRMAGHLRRRARRIGDDKRERVLRLRRPLRAAGGQSLAKVRHDYAFPRPRHFRRR